MIRIVMLGRVANNLFQYALGRVLAERHGVALRMDASWFNADGWGQVICLRRLNLQAEIVRSFSFGSRALRKLSGKHHWEFLGVPVMREAREDHRFARRFVEAPDPCVLMGYFQSPGYFQSIEAQLREELRMDHLPWQEATRTMAQALRSQSSVAVHVRRGDYLNHPLWQVCDVSYYLRAMDRLRGEVEGARFFVFSDDPAWCREHLTGEDVEVCALAEAAGDPLHDLYLMSACRHHIIANSSYSWWGAWLAKGEGQRVFCPPRWFQGDEILAPIEEKRCEGWEVMKS